MINLVDDLTLFPIRSPSYVIPNTILNILEGALDELVLDVPVVRNIDINEPIISLSP